MYQQQFLGYFITQCTSMLLKQFVCLSGYLRKYLTHYDETLHAKSILDTDYTGKKSRNKKNPRFLPNFFFIQMSVSLHIDTSISRLYLKAFRRSIQVQMGLQSIPKGEIDVIVSFISINWKSGQPFASRQVSIKKNAKVNFEKMMQVQHYQNTNPLTQKQESFLIQLCRYNALT